MQPFYVCHGNQPLESRGFDDISFSLLWLDELSITFELLSIDESSTSLELLSINELEEILFEVELIFDELICNSLIFVGDEVSFGVQAKQTKGINNKYLLFII